MNAILAQAAALAAHAKARALDPSLAGDEWYWSRHSTFRFVRALRFVARRRRFLRSIDEEIASTPSAWMATLPRDGEIMLVALGSSLPLAPHLAVALAGGTREAIAVSTSRETSLWIPAWRVVAQHPETKIWSVEYAKTRMRASLPASTTIEHARDRLATALREIGEFAAARGNLDEWRKTFDAAAASLGAAEPLAPYHPDILPGGGYSADARRLLAAAVGAFVFGGMGSWNDLGFAERDVHARYEQLTKELYSAVIDALVAAVNRGTSRP